MSITSTSRVCSRCGCTLTGAYFDFGYGWLLCHRCQGYVMVPSVMPYSPPQPNYTVNWLAENARLSDELSQAKQRIAELEAMTTWDEERRNKLASLLESYAHTHRQFYFPNVTEFDTQDTDVTDDIQALWGIRRQIGELIGIPPLPKNDGTQS